jgi:beta-lactamase class A
LKPLSIRRRALLNSILLSPLLCLAPSCEAAQSAAAATTKLAELETRTGGRLGLSVLDTHTGSRFSFRGTERFPMCSTFKVLASALVLARVDKGEESLARRVTYGKEKLVTYSPATQKHVGGNGMSLTELCEAAITLSDNTAGNLLLESFGGPAALTGWLRSIGDGTTRLDRWETDLNEARKGDPRDTTTPDAMLATLGNLALGSVLSATSRDQLAAWMVANTTGGARLRAGLPADWKVGDKTGTGENIAIIWPARRKPILVAAYVAEATVTPQAVNAVFAEVGRVVAGRA